jgi:hypothetical protein
MTFHYPLSIIHYPLSIICGGGKRLAYSKEMLLLKHNVKNHTDLLKVSASWRPAGEP